MTGTTSSIWRGAPLDRSGKRRAGRMRGARSSPWPILKRMRVAGPRAKKKSRSPIAIEVVRLIDALFEIERSINGKSAQERLDVRRTLSRPIVEGLQAYMREQVAKLSRGHNLAKAFNYIAELTPWIDGAREGLIASFANGVAKDEAAVRAAIALPWSNGQTEGQITLLKLVVSTVVKFRGGSRRGRTLKGARGSGLDFGAGAVAVSATLGATLSSSDT